MRTQAPSTPHAARRGFFHAHIQMINEPKGHAMTPTLTPQRTSDTTWWPLPGQRSIGAHWNVATRRWDVLHLGHGLESSWGSYAEDAREAAELAAQAAYGLLLWVVA